MSKVESLSRACLFFGLFLAAAGTAAAEDRTFQNPTVKNVRVNWCKHWERECGKPAADLFCREIGYEQATQFTIDENLGARGIDTLVFGDGRMCRGAGCNGFKSITCTRPGAGAAPPGTAGARGRPPVPTPEQPAIDGGMHTKEPAEPDQVTLPPIKPPSAREMPYEEPKKPRRIQNICTLQPESCCPKGATKTDGCRKVMQAFLDIRIRSYVPPRFTVMGHYGVQGTDANRDFQIMVADRKVSGYIKSVPCRYSITYMKNAILSDNSFAEEFVNLLDDMLKQWSSGLESAKSFVANNVAEGVCDTVGGSQECRDTVAGAVRTGINAGLVSMGIPPEIPDLEQLRRGGVNYLAAQAVSYGLGDAEILLKSLPEDLRRALYEKAYAEAGAVLGAELDKALPKANFSPENPASWGHPEPAYVPHNAHLYIEIKIKPFLYDKYMQFLVKKPDHRWLDLTLWDQSEVYGIKSIEIPAFIPASGMILPVELKPVSVGPATDQAKPVRIPGTFITWTWLRKRFGIEHLVRSQFNYWPNIDHTEYHSDWDLFYESTGKYSFSLYTAFTSSSAIFWEQNLSGSTGGVWDAVTGEGVWTKVPTTDGTKGSKPDGGLKDYYGRLDPPNYCDGNLAIVACRGDDNNCYD